MAKPKFDTSFNFGANVTSGGKAKKRKGKKGKGSKGKKPAGGGS
jgi:hypothetical protein